MVNHKSAMAHAVQLGAQLDEAARLNMVEYYDPVLHGSERDFAHNIIPLGARVKPSGSIRMLVDPALPGINNHMQTLPCKLPTIEEIFQHVKPHSVLGKRDLTNGFFHCVLTPEARRHMAYRHPVTGRLARWVVLPQGTKQSPSIFCEVSQAAADIFNKAAALGNIKALVFVYVDDYIIIADSHEDMVRMFTLMDEEASQLGLHFNPEKDYGRDAPLTSIIALGIRIDASKQELSLPDDKRAAYAQAVADFTATYKDTNRAPRKALESLVGKLLYACRVCRWGYLYVQELLDSLYPAPFLPQPPREVALSEGAWNDLHFWHITLDLTSGAWSGVKKHMLGTKDVHVDPSQFPTQLYTDASKQFGVGGVMGAETLSLQWDKDMRDIHIGTLELKALHISLEHWKHDLYQQTVLAWMDNIQAVSAVNKGASRIPALRPILLDIAKLGMQYGFELKAKHIQGKCNPADAPSRGLQATKSSDWFFTEFARFNQPPAQIDCCCAESGYNRQQGCTEWYSMARPMQEHVQQLAGKVLWVNAPFSILGPVLDAVVHAWRLAPTTTVATIVAPHWPDATWYRKYLRRILPNSHTCDVCNCSSGRLINCINCQACIHPPCLGLGRHAYPAQTFTCATCVLEEAKVAQVSEKTAEAAHRLVWLRGMRVQDSSQHTYASGLHRYVRFGRDVCNQPAQAMLPPGDQGIDRATLHLFISWAASKYKYNTIQSTLSALADWHKSKGTDHPAISCKPTKTLLATVKNSQGPAGLPTGKQGLTKPMLKLLLKYLHNQGSATPHMAELLLRDECIVLLGFYGMLRRSEIIELTLDDVRTGTADGKPYVELNIKKSKTDRGRVGATVTITGYTRDGVDIISPLHRYIELRARYRPSSTSPLFTAWDLDSLTSSATKKLTGQALAKRLQLHLLALKAKYPAIQVNPKSYGMHSLRRAGSLLPGSQVWTLRKLSLMADGDRRLFVHTCKRPEASD
jgi:integrase